MELFCPSGFLNEIYTDKQRVKSALRFLLKRFF
jgi:hypothetical protein